MILMKYNYSCVIVISGEEGTPHVMIVNHDYLVM